MMLQKKVDNIDISKMRTIRLMEADLNQVLKWASREIMRAIEQRPEGLSDMQFGFRKHRTTHQEILSTTSIIDIARQIRYWVTLRPDYDDSSQGMRRILRART